MTLDFFIGVVLAWSVIDGDTIRVDLKPWPNHAAIEERIRFLGIDTAEVHSKVPCEHELAAQASAYTRAALTAAKRIVVVVPVDAAGRDSFGRVLGTVYVDGRSLNDALLAAGLARPYGTKRVWCQ